MKISAQEEYGLRCLLQLATLSENESLTLPQIAGREGISVANAGKLLWLLNKAGFVQATRGTKGGYSLARSASEIRPVIVGLHEIVENALSQITLAQLVGTESSVDATFHQIQGIHRTIETV